MNPLTASFRARAEALRQKHAERVARLSPAIDAELGALDREGLVARLKAEGHASFACAGREVPADAFLNGLGRCFPTSELRSLVHDVLLLKAIEQEEEAPDAEKP